MPVFALFPYMLSGVALGIAEGLIDEFSSRRNKTGKMTGARIAEIQSTQIRLGEAAAYARASRRVQEANCYEAQQLIASGRVPDIKTKARYRLEGAYAVEWAVRAVDVMFGLSGAAGLYESGHAARAFRDAHAVKQHFSFNTDIASTTYGRVALGLPSDNATL
jgi:3-hydroxy-9,10-secoandrosta-1,3,5(10)-triene-9,17-dione monooxygenase